MAGNNTIFLCGIFKLIGALFMNILEKVSKFETLVEQEKLNLDNIKRKVATDKLSAKYTEKTLLAEATPKSVDSLMEKYSTHS
jgi:hypothetical protein